MMLIIGLGNPGEQFKNTRHNIGREIVIALQKNLELTEFRFEKKWNSRVCEGKIDKERVAIVIPDTMMNKSGNAVTQASRFYKTKPKNIFLVHDDADLPLGRAKLSFGKHSAGHKGVESVMRALKTWDFWRFRIGIQKKRRMDAMKLVLQKFAQNEKKLAKKMVKRTIETLQLVAGVGPERAMNEYNK